MFICMPKTNFIIHVFLEILLFKESSNLIGWHRFGLSLENQNFARYGIRGEISKTILVSNLDYFQERLLRKFFKKFKKPYFGAILGPFSMKGVCQFLDIPIIYHRAKNQTKLMSHFWEKSRTDGQTGRQAGRQAERQTDKLIL